MKRRALRKPSLITCATAAALALVALSGCHKKPLGPPWVQLDLTQEKPFVELTPPGISENQVYQQRVGHLGSTEVRDLSKVPADQQQTFPSSAGEVRVVEQIAGSRLKWRVHVDDGSYVSFTPVGFEKPCDACKYRMGVRTAKGVEVLWEAMAQPVGPAAPKAVEVDLSKYADSDLDLLFQIEGPAPAAPGQLTPSVVWDSLALYSRQPQHTAFKPDRPNILLVGIDTLRADRVGPWGRRPSLTPTLDQLAAESDVWTEAFTAFNVTNPSFVSIMTGLYGKNHGVYDLHTRLPASFATLARLLSDAGYQTLAVIAARHLGDHNSGLGQGFAEVLRSDEHYAAELGVNKTLAWLAAHCTRPHPFFVWLHVFDPHTPHTPPQPYSAGFRPAHPMGLGPVTAWVPFRTPGPRTYDEPILAGNRDLYDGQVAYVDRQLGRLLDGMASRGLLDDTLVAVVADHGENLGDHGFSYRHVGLYDTTTHVPLLIRWPGPPHPGHRYEGLVQTIDLFPTLLAAARLPVPDEDGIDLRRLANATGRRAVFAEHSNNTGAMVRTRDYQYLVSRGNAAMPDGPSLFDLRADPQELHNLAGQGLPVQPQLATLLDTWLARRRPRPNAPSAQPHPLSPEDAARLRALGYAGGGTR